MGYVSSHEVNSCRMGLSGIPLKDYNSLGNPLSESEPYGWLPDGQGMLLS